MTAQRHVVVTGAGGYIGSRLAARLLDEPAFADARFSWCDQAVPTPPDDPRVRVLEGDLTEAAVRRDLLGDGVDVAFHLAGVLGGAAERDPALARRVNVDATLSLFEELAALGTSPRLVFASSIAVFGPPFPAIIDDGTPAFPTMLYGAQKLMTETALTQMSARGMVDGIALRLPGIVARAGADARQKAAFLNLVFERFVRGGAIDLPVSAEGTTWLISADACVDAFVHAGRLDGARLGQRRAMTLPAQNVRIGELVAALRAAFPDSVAEVTYSPDRAIEEQFANQPPQRTDLADGLGFRHDGSLAELVRRATVDMVA